MNNNQITSASGTVGEGQIDIHGSGSANVTYQGTPIAYSVKFTLALVGNVTPLSVPEILVQPESLTNVLGSTATFSIVATGADVSAYRWRKNSANLVGSAHIKGANSDTLIITNITAGDAGNYTCVIPNSIGSVTSVVAQLVVLLPPTSSITMPTLNQHWTNNSLFSVTGTASGNAGVSDVQVSADGINWSDAGSDDSFANWTADVNLAAGTNIIYAYAIDANGNHSDRKSVV